MQKLRKLGLYFHVKNLYARSQRDFMYLQAILCTFQISVDFYYVPVGGRGGGAGEGGA